jgi:hypothetical protein
LANPPEVAPGLEYYYHAFVELSTCRTIGMSEGPIPWTAMHTYAQSEKLDPEETEYFMVLLQMVDMMYLSYRDKEQKRKQVSKQGSK